MAYKSKRNSTKMARNGEKKRNCHRFQRRRGGERELLRKEMKNEREVQYDGDDICKGNRKRVGKGLGVALGSRRSVK